jgi:hypothetical protein
VFHWLLAAALAQQPTLDHVRAAERAGDPATQAALCQALISDAPPDDPAAATCRRTLETLEPLRDTDGTWTTLTALEAARRGQGHVAWDPALPPALQVEVGLWHAQAVLLDGGAPTELTSALWALEMSEDHRVRVRRVHVQALTAAGRLDDARALAPDVDPAARARAADTVAATTQQRSVLRWISWGLLGVFGLLSPAAVKGWRVKPRPMPVGVGVIAAVGGAAAAICWSWEPRAGWGALALIPALAGVHLVATGAMLQLGPRWPVRVLSGLAACASGFLVLARMDLLDWLGL